ncbi:MAG: ECF-type sigma factor [Isosphaeraceae bacterium]
MPSEIRAGSPDAKDRLVQAIYGELLRTDRGMMLRARRDHTLDAGALVNEALVRLFSGEGLAEISDGRNLRAAAAQPMRQVLVDQGRRRNTGKREGQPARVPLDHVLADFGAHRSLLVHFDQSYRRNVELA